jgi:hypothetical protein
MSTISMRAYRDIALGIFFACVAASNGAFANSATGTTYVGKWASQPDQCTVGQEAENAPLVMKTKGYDRHEAHCVFGSVSRKGSTWKTHAKCDIEGDKRKLGLTLSVAGSGLTVKYSDGGSESYQRCP